MSHFLMSYFWINEEIQTVIRSNADLNPGSDTIIMPMRNPVSPEMLVLGAGVSHHIFEPSYRSYEFKRLKMILPHHEVDYKFYNI